MNLPLFILSSSIGFLSFLTFVVFSRLSLAQNPKKVRKYDLLCDFPYEIYPVFSANSAVARISFALFELSFPLFAISLFSLEFLHPMMGFMVFCMAIFFFKGTFYALLHFVPASIEKAHIALALVSFLLESVCAFVAGLFLFRALGVDYPALSWLFAIIFWLISLFMLGLSLNPRLLKWERMKVVEDMDGSHLEKPRPFVLAFSEWIAIGVDVLLFLLIFGSFLTIGLLY